MPERDPTMPELEPAAPSSAPSAAPPAAPPAALPAEAGAELGQYLARLTAAAGVPGLAYSLFTAERELHTTLSGWRDREAAAPVTEDTIFGVASITKSFTCLAALQLAVTGALAIDDPVTRYLPFRLWGEAPAPTLRHLMNHTSGLPPLPTMTWLRGPTQAGDPVSGGDAELVLAMASARGGALPDVASHDGLVRYIDAEATPLGPPGTLFSYSNDAFCLLAAVVERVAGEPFDSFVAQRILAPLGMRRSTFALGRVLSDPDHATLYARDEAGRVRRSPDWEDAGVMLGGGALKSSLADLRRYVRFLMRPERAGELGLEPSAVRAMGAGTVWSGVGQRYGLGLQESTAPAGGRLLGHGGSLKGVSSHIAWLPETGVGVVVLTNLGGVPSDLLALAGVNAVSGQPVDTPAYRPAPYQARPGEVEPLLGRYASGEPYGRVRLYRAADGQLRAEVGLPAEDLAAELVGPDEVALAGAWKRQALTALRRGDGSVWAVFHGSRVLRRQD